jgi:hypothetical protein
MVSPGREDFPAGAVLCHPNDEDPSLGISNSAKGPVSRILSCAVIPLGAALPRTLISDLPGGFGVPRTAARCRAEVSADRSEPPERVGPMRSGAWLLTRASLPIWSCSVWGLPCPRRYRRSGALLPHHFTLTPALRQQAASGSPSRKRGSRGGIFSVALAVHGL